MGSSKYYLSCNLFVTCNLQLICMPRKKVTNLSIINHHSIPSFGPTHLHVDQLSLGSVFFSLTAEFRGAVTATCPKTPWENSRLREEWMRSPLPSVHLDAASTPWRAQLRKQPWDQFGAPIVGTWWSSRPSWNLKNQCLANCRAWLDGLVWFRQGWILFFFFSFFFRWLSPRKAKGLWSQGVFFWLFMSKLISATISTHWNGCFRSEFTICHPLQIVVV